jgi:tetratricopeptide (TPR) repeat protein
MKLAARVRLFAMLSVLAPAGFVIWEAPRTGITHALGWAFWLFVGLYLWAIGPVLRAQRLLDDAIRVENTSAAREQMTQIQPVSRLVPTIHGVLPQWEASLLLIEERYEEALPKVEALVPASKAGKPDLYRMNSLAWCLAHTGNAIRSIEIARSVLQAAERNEDGILYPYALATLGTAYLFAEQPAQAVNFLERSLTAGDESPRSQATRAYYLGESYRSMGKKEAARQAYQRAIQELPGSRYAAHAEERLRLL